MKKSTALNIASGVVSVLLAGLGAVCSLISKREEDAAQTEKINKAVSEALANRDLITK